MMIEPRRSKPNHSVACHIGNLTEEQANAIVAVFEQVKQLGKDTRAGDFTFSARVEKERDYRLCQSRFIKNKDGTSCGVRELTTEDIADAERGIYHEYIFHPGTKGTFEIRSLPDDSVKKTGEQRLYESSIIKNQDGTSWGVRELSPEDLADAENGVYHEYIFHPGTEGTVEKRRLPDDPD